MKIAIVVQGRFHAFELARSLIEKGHAVTVFTNYPRFVAARFGLPKDCVRSFLTHGVVANGIDRLGVHERLLATEEALHTLFARWACRQVCKESWDVIYGWSGVSEDILRTVSPARTLRLLVRGSAHVRSQARLLIEEERRTA